MDYSQKERPNYDQNRTVFIEHCVNCPQHQWCTKHKEEHYLSKFHKLKDEIERHFNFQVISNFVIDESKIVINDENPNSTELKVITKSGKIVNFPQLGSFEIVFRSKKIFSKLVLGLWPNTKKILQKIQDVIDQKEIPDYDSIVKIEESTVMNPLAESRASTSSQHKKFNQRFYGYQQQFQQSYGYQNNMQKTGYKTSSVEPQVRTTTMGAQQVIIEQNQQDEEADESSGRNKNNNNYNNNTKQNNPDKKVSQDEKKEEKSQEYSDNYEEYQQEPEKVEKQSDKQQQQKQQLYQYAEEEDQKSDKYEDSFDEEEDKPKPKPKQKHKKKANNQKKQQMQQKEEEKQQQQYEQQQNQKQKQSEKQLLSEEKVEPIQKKKRKKKMSKNSTQQQQQKKQQKSNDYDQDSFEQEEQKYSQLQKQQQEEENQDFTPKRPETKTGGRGRSKQESRAAQQQYEQKLNQDEDAEVQQQLNSDEDAEINNELLEYMQQMQQLDSIPFEEEKSTKITITANVESKKKVTLQLKQEGEAILQIFSSNPQFLLIREPQLQVEGPTKVPISLLFKAMPENTENKVKFFVLLNESPWSKITLNVRAL